MGFARAATAAQGAAPQTVKWMAKQHAMQALHALSARHVNSSIRHVVHGNEDLVCMTKPCMLLLA